MDESWRMRMGMPPTVTVQQHNHPRRRSTEDVSHRRRTLTGEPENILLDPEDFNDVFGGPPRIVMARHFPGSSRSSLYEEIFQQSEDVGPAGNGRSLPQFKIPTGKSGRRGDQGFYNDIFGWDEEEVMRRSRTRSGSKSKASSSSALSSEEVSPLPFAGNCGSGRDDDVLLFASKLRPINIPSRWGSKRMAQEEEQQQRAQYGPFLWNKSGNEYYNEDLRTFHLGICPGNSSPESIISVEPNPRGAAKASADEFVPNSPSSAVSSVCQESEVVASKARDEMMQEEEEENDDDEVMDSYVIELSSDNREGTDDATGVDEAIAWAKEKFQNYRAEDTTCGANYNGKELEIFTEARGARREEEIPERQKIDGHRSSEEDSEMEMEILDEKVRLWSSNKEDDIRLLLSTLHHILWPNSGWVPVPLASLIDGSQVKKAYQKARLCLHPDKLQQRGATLEQKHVAEKAFSTLQDAWAAFINQDVL